MMLFSSALAAFTGVFVRDAVQYMPVLEVTFFRNLFGVVIISFTIFRTPILSKGGKPFVLFLRGLLGFLSLLFYFYAMAETTLANAITFNKLAPVFTAFFAYVFLKEHLSLKGWLAIFIGFVGVVFVTKPTDFSFEKVEIIGLLSGVGAGAAYTAIRELRSYYDTRAILLSFMLCGTLGPIVFMLIGEVYTLKGLEFVFAPFVIPPKESFVALVCIGLSATLSQYLMTKAYTLTKAAIVGTIGYASIFFSVIAGFFVGDAFPDIYTWIGIGLIIISGLSISRQK